MLNNIKIATLAALLGMVACGVVNDPAPGKPANAEIGDPVGPPDGAAEHSPAQVARWIDQNRDRLPSSYDQILQFPQQYRWAIFGAQPPEVKSAIFRTQIARIRLRPDLTDEQRDVLDRADAVMSSALYAPHDSPQFLATVDMQHDLERRAIAAFGYEGARAAIVHLGPPEATTLDSPTPASYPPYCDCNQVSDWCLLFGKKCRNIPCITTNLCGTAGAYTCNGVCGAGA